MTLQLLHCEFPDIWRKFDFLFYQCGHLTVLFQSFPCFLSHPILYSSLLFIHFLLIFLFFKLIAFLDQVRDWRGCGEVRVPGQHRAQAQPIHGSGGGRPQGEHRNSTQPIDSCALTYQRACGSGLQGKHCAEAQRISRARAAGFQGKHRASAQLIHRCWDKGFWEETVLLVKSAELIQGH